MEPSFVKQIEQPTPSELVAKNRQTRFESKSFTFKDPRTLIPHPVSASLYGEIDAMEIRGWRPDKSPFLSDNTSIAQRMDITDLLKSIEREGILEPLVINERGFIISGSRRWIAALWLDLPTVPVEVRHFKNEIEEQQAILDYNLQRDKSFSQKMREAELLKEIEGKRTKLRMLAGKRVPTTQIFGEGHSSNRHNMETAAIVGARIGMGRDTFKKAEQIWDKAKEGDEKAAEYVKALDDNTMSVHSAYVALKKKDSNLDEPKISELQTAEPVDLAEVWICPQCQKSIHLLHLSHGNRHKLIEC